MEVLAAEKGAVDDVKSAQLLAFQVTEVRPLQPEHALLPMVETELGMFRVLKPVNPLQR